MFADPHEREQQEDPENGLILRLGHSEDQAAASHYFRVRKGLERRLGTPRSQSQPRGAPHGHLWNNLGMTTTKWQ